MRAGDQSGLSLMEVVVAAAVLGVGLVALSTAIPLAVYGVQEGAQLSTAVFLAHQRLEQVRMARWEDGAPETDELGISPAASEPPRSETGTTPFPDERPIAAPYERYSRIVRVTDCGGGCGGVASSDLRQVSVTVSYRPMTGVGLTARDTVKPVTLTTYVARR